MSQGGYRVYGYGPGSSCGHEEGSSLVKEAEVACKAGIMTLASDKAKAALAIPK
jgi:hypothetical protein